MTRSDGFENRYAVWLGEVDRWRRRHGLTREQAVSILPENDTEDWRSLFQWAEVNEFLHRFREGDPTT